MSMANTNMSTENQEIFHSLEIHESGDGVVEEGMLLQLRFSMEFICLRDTCIFFNLEGGWLLILTHSFAYWHIACSFLTT